MVSKTLDPRLVEYQKAQDSAEHHDNLTWTILGVMLGGMFFLLKYSFEHINDSDFDTKVFILIISMFGIYVCHAQQPVRNRAYKIIKEKYNICRKIERQFGMEQHLMIKKITEKGRKKPIVDFIMWCMQFPWYYILLRIVLSLSAEFCSITQTVQFPFQSCL